MVSHSLGVDMTIYSWAGSPCHPALLAIPPLDTVRHCGSIAAGTSSRSSCAATNLCQGNNVLDVVKIDRSGQRVGGIDVPPHLSSHIPHSKQATLQSRVAYVVSDID